MVRWTAVVLLVLAGLVDNSSCKTRRDTYLTAYMESQGYSSTSPGEVYGAPAMEYGAPATAGYSYEAPVEPHTLPENPFEPLHAKLILVFKVLLKLLVFKLIVKFLAIICVLFFLPKLSGLGIVKEAKDGARKIKEKEEDERLQLTQFILSSISGSSVNTVCRAEDSLFCRLKRAIEEFDQMNPVSRLFGIYLKEEEEKLRHRGSRKIHKKFN